ncbi:hypothetical protein NC651_034740 [Populus alba x Populus x berolinensis]|nr:hypothetical protein NC651_034740 [Populus alba x Populus x berolinensis]
MLNYMNQRLAINLKDALFLLNVTCRVCCQLLALIIRTDALALLNAKDKHNILNKDMTINLKDPKVQS